MLSALVAALSYVTIELFASRSIRFAAFAFLLGEGIIVGVTMLFLARTIRLDRRIRLHELPVPCQISWPLGEFPRDAADYESRFVELDVVGTIQNLKRLHFVSLQLVRRKYSQYRLCAVGTDLALLWGVFGLVILSGISILLA